MATLSRTGVIFRRATFGIFSLAIASYSLTPAGEGPAQAQLSSTAPERMLAQAAAAAATARATLAIQVLSNRADMISGGDALVQIVSSTGAYGSIAKIDLNGIDITKAFAMRADGRFMGLVTGLVNGPNLLRARLADGTGARITITNHSAEGPVFSGRRYNHGPATRAHRTRNARVCQPSSTTTCLPASMPRPTLQASPSRADPTRISRPTTRPIRLHPRPSRRPRPTRASRFRSS